jgi:arylsulfatase
VTPLELTLRDEPVTDREHERHLSNYRGAARYLDDALTELIERVDWDLLFVISDHGELFGEHGLRGHQYGMYEELVHVPAVAFGDAVDPGSTTTLTSLVDVHRTLLEVADLPVAESHRGVDLLEDAPDDDRAVYAESEGSEWYGPNARGIEARIPSSWNEPHYMVRTDDAMLLVDKDGTRAVDPETGERKPERRSELEERAAAIRADREDRSGGQNEESIPPEVRDRLERLGYR